MAIKMVLDVTLEQVMGGSASPNSTVQPFYCCPKDPTLYPSNFVPENAGVVGFKGANDNAD